MLGLFNSVAARLENQGTLYSTEWNLFIFELHPMWSCLFNLDVIYIMFLVVYFLLLQKPVN